MQSHYYNKILVRKSLNRMARQSYKNTRHASTASPGYISRETEQVADAINGEGMSPVHCNKRMYSREPTPMTNVSSCASSPRIRPDSQEGPDNDNKHSCDTSTLFSMITKDNEDTLLKYEIPLPAVAMSTAAVLSNSKTETPKRNSPHARQGGRQHDDSPHTGGQEWPSAGGKIDHFRVMIAVACVVITGVGGGWVLNMLRAPYNTSCTHRGLVPFLATQGAMLAASIKYSANATQQKRLQATLVLAAGEEEDFLALVGGFHSSELSTTLSATHVVDFARAHKDLAHRNTSRHHKTTATDTLRQICTDISRSLDDLQSLYKGLGTVKDPTYSHFLCTNDTHNTTDDEAQIKLDKMAETNATRERGANIKLWTPLTEPDLIVWVGCVLHHSIIPSITRMGGERAVIMGHSDYKSAHISIRTACDNMWEPVALVDITHDTKGFGCKCSAASDEQMYMLTLSRAGTTQDRLNACSSPPMLSRPANSEL